ncbi:DUF6192 family protein [Streptomyces sp. IBSBF 2435]|uniref:DUF6192 family protein n=1 Tax=Streptomyces sp. IBSBF 2435 TaxID=2903531 RepID=UPI002FDC63A3
MRGRGGSAPAEELFTVRDSLHRLAEDIAVSYRTVEGARWAASKWPAEHRVKGVSFTIHRTPAGISDPEERFAAVLTPPEGTARWTPDEASRRVGRQVAKPVTPQEKISAIHTLAKDDEVAAAVTGDLLRRPSVVAQVRDEDKVRAVAELTREDQVAAAVAPGFLRRPAGGSSGAPVSKSPPRRGRRQAWRDSALPPHSGAGSTALPRGRAAPGRRGFGSRHSGADGHHSRVGAGVNECVG